MHDTEDRFWWYDFGEQKEREFITKLNSLGIPARRNPAKDYDKTAPDLFVRDKLSDLKGQFTPYFKSGEQHGVESINCVTFNRDDFIKYDRYYPGIWIYFWQQWPDSEWQDARGRDYFVQAVDDVYAAHFSLIRNLVLIASAHDYERRKSDLRYNEPSSFVLDVRSMHSLCKYLETTRPPKYEQMQLL